MLDDAVHAVFTAYPAIHAACRRHPPRVARRRDRVSPHLATVLEQLDPVQPLALGELAARMQVSPATMSLQVALLGRLRLLTRDRDAADARRVQLRLTESGARLRARHSLLDPTRVRSALRRLSPAERDAVVSGLRLLARAVRELPPQPAPPAPPGSLDR